jgi:membrane-associated sensor protein
MKSTKNIIFTILLVGTIGLLIPLIISYLVIPNIFTSDQIWIQEPFHSFIETAGSIISIFLAAILLVGQTKKNSRYIVIASAFIAMGIFDVFHSWSPINNNFVWLHSLATLFGGALFFLLFLPKKLLGHIQTWWITLVTFLTLLIGSYSFIFPSSIPNMIINGQFSSIAKSINYIGGVLFLLATIKFINFYKTSQDKNDQYFAILCSFFGMSGLLFETSNLWDANWWWWHILRFIAYLFVFYYSFHLYRQANLKLTENLIELKQAQAGLSQALSQAQKSTEEAKLISTEQEKLNQAMVGRELKMIELKKEIQKLKNV